MDAAMRRARFVVWFTVVIGAATPFDARAAGPAKSSSAWSLEFVAAQIALEGAAFSPGVIDGCLGPKTRMALRGFQASRGLAVTGELDAATRAALGVDLSTATRHYRITSADVAAVGPWPKSWVEKSRVKRLGYKSLAALVAERGHCTQALLRRLNPGHRLDALSAGDELVIPNVSPSSAAPTATRLLVNLSEKTIRPVDASGRVLGLFHCSIAKHKAKRPSGRCRVKVVTRDPVYIFDPKMWPEVRGVNRKLVIPPGPRNPVGLCWIGLSLPGYGIHGTPEPELIGKTGSHGCFRLTNWDALRLAEMVRPGVTVEFTTGATTVPPPRATADRAVGRRSRPGLRSMRRRVT